MLSGSDTKDAQRGGLVLIDTAINAGIKADQNVSMSGRDPQSAYTPVINQMKADGSNYSLTTMATSNAIQLRSEAQLQGLTSPDIVWACTTCYDSSLKEQRRRHEPFDHAPVVPPVRGGVDQRHAGELREVRRQGQGRQLLGVRMDRHPRVRRGGEGGRREGWRQRADPREPARTMASRRSRSSTPAA